MSTTATVLKLFDNFHFSNNLSHTIHNAKANVPLTTYTSDMSKFAHSFIESPSKLYYSTRFIRLPAFFCFIAQQSQFLTIFPSNTSRHDGIDLVHRNMSFRTKWMVIVVHKCTLCLVSSFSIWLWWHFFSPFNVTRSAREWRHGLHISYPYACIRTVPISVQRKPKKKKKLPTKY